MIDWLILILIGVLGAAIVLSIINVSNIIECARKWWGSRTPIIVVSPESNAELEKIAAQKGSKRYKRFVYNRSTGQSQLVESDSISNDLIYRNRVKLYVS